MECFPYDLILPSIHTLKNLSRAHTHTWPPERSRLLDQLFSILNGSFDDDQKRAQADYMEFSLMIQYNERDERRFKASCQVDGSSKIVRIVPGGARWAIEALQKLEKFLKFFHWP